MYQAITTLPRPEQQVEQPGQPIYWGPSFNDSHFALDEIYLNTTTLKTVLWLSTLGGVVLHDTATAPPETAADEKPFISGISSISLGGTAMASGSSRIRRTKVHAEKSALRVPPEQQDALPNRQRPFLEAAIDKNNIAKVVAERKPGVTPTLALARALDSAVRLSLDMGAREKLLQTKDKDQKLLLFVSLANIAIELSAVAQAALDASLVSNLGFAVGLYGFTVAAEAGYHKFAYGSLGMREKQWSLSPFHAMPDRYLLARSVLRESTFVKHRPNK